MSGRTDNGGLALLISSGNGPGECRQAAGYVLARLRAEAEALGLEVDITVRGEEAAPSSAVVMLHGADARALAANWVDVILWRCPSRLRPGHGRKNWFVQVHTLPEAPPPVTIDPSAVEMQAIRAGGPGGQHVNKASSAIRARWRSPQGRIYAVVVRDERSQHQNRRLALERLSRLAAQDIAAHEEDAKAGARCLHHRLQRANPSRTFEGDSFREVPA